MPTQSITLNSVTPNPLPQGTGQATVTFTITGNYTGTIQIIATPVGGGTPVVIGSTTVSQPNGNNQYVRVIDLTTTNLDPNVDWVITARDPVNGVTSAPPPIIVDVIPCFAEGTRIATARGEVAVEDLRVGDLVVTPHGNAALQPVVWIGRSTVNVARQRNRALAAPILIKAGALADGVPCRDLRVSPEHAMFLDGHLVPARLLVNGTSIVQELWCPEVTYWHVELPSHGLLVAEGAVSESYFDDGNRKHFDNYGITTLFKDFESERGNRRYAEAACYPLLLEGAALDRLRGRLDARVATDAAEARLTA